MNYLLDTNICVALIRQQSAPALHRLTAALPGDVGVSVITVSELCFGAEKSAHPQKNAQAVEQFLLPLVVVPFDHQAARVYGNLRAFLEKSGTPIPSMDMLIGAHARSLDVTLATNNLQDFPRIPNLKDWLS